MEPMLQLAIAVVGLATALVTLAISVRQYRDPQKPKAGHRPGWLLGLALTVGVLSVLTPYVVIPRLLPKAPLAVIQTPASGERIRRPQNVEVSLNGSVPKDHTVWLGYQNEAGGPYIVQAARCSAIVKRLDCGPLYVGHNEQDRAEFRLFVATANEAATARLSARDMDPGGNVPYPVLPDGVTVVSEQRHITLQTLR